MNEEFPKADNTLYYYTLGDSTTSGSLDEWVQRVLTNSKDAASGGQWKRLRLGRRFFCPEPASIAAARLRAKESRREDLVWSPSDGWIHT